MSKISLRKSLFGQFSLLVQSARWLPISALVGVMAGSASALLLASLEYATRMREQHVWLILLLAPAGWLIGLLYAGIGTSVERGSNLILEEVHDPTETIPLRMTPLVLFGTFVTHLFGGSAGREGTAIQMGASLADQLSRPFHMDRGDRRILLMAGISAGFASVFGTPVAGCIFGIEVLAIGQVTYEAIGPCIVAAFVGDIVTHAWGLHHAVYSVSIVPQMSLLGVLYSMIAGMIFGLTSMGFAKLTEFVSHMGRKFIAKPSLRPVAGGLIVTLAVFAIGTPRSLKYIGLGLPTIAAAFQRNVAPYDFAVKSIFTAVTLGTGFKGGEVTPLFYIGSTLGNVLAHILPLPPSLLAAMGFVAVFSGAANTPIASTLMAVELFGSGAGAYAAIACVLSYLFSGHAGIYTSQRIGRSKQSVNVEEEGLSLSEAAKLHTAPEE